MSHNVIVIGGGASGMMAAIEAARKGNKVIILEHMERPGKKILMTGNGKCNYSNTVQNKECYRTGDSSFVERVLKVFGQQQTTEFFKSLSIATKDKNGYLYPYSGQASIVVDALVKKCLAMGVDIKCGIQCKRISKSPKGTIEIECKEQKGNNTTVYSADSVILSTGGRTYEKSGSDGSGYKILSELGHNIIKPLPALTALKCKDEYLKIWKGVRCDGEITLLCGEQKIACDKGELQLTDYGVSGIPVFQVSRYASRYLDNNKKITALIDFVPFYSYKELNTHIKNAEKYMDLYQVLSGVVNRKVAEVVLKKCSIPLELNVSELSNRKISLVVEMLKSMKLQVTGTGDFSQAQVCTGGVALNEINPDTMESLKCSNVFVTGELLDVDGICGGYNLQWAWSTGYIAGKNA